MFVDFAMFISLVHFSPKYQSIQGPDERLRSGPCSTNAHGPDKSLVHGPDPSLVHRGHNVCAKVTSILCLRPIFAKVTAV